VAGASVDGALPFGSHYAYIWFTNQADRRGDW